MENAEKMAPGEFQAPTEMPPLEKVSPGAKEAPAAKPASVEKSSLREKAETTAKPASIPSRALILFNQNHARPSLKPIERHGRPRRETHRSSYNRKGAPASTSQPPNDYRQPPRWDYGPPPLA